MMRSASAGRTGTAEMWRKEGSARKMRESDTKRKKERKSIAWIQLDTVEAGVRAGTGGRERTVVQVMKVKTAAAKARKKRVQLKES